MIRTKLQIEGRTRDLAMFDLAIDSKLRGCEVVVHDIRNYARKIYDSGCGYADAVTIAEDGTPVADLTKIGALEPDVGDHLEPGWTEREETLE